MQIPNALLGRCSRPPRSPNSVRCQSGKPDERSPRVQRPSQVNGFPQKGAVNLPGISLFGAGCASAFAFIPSLGGIGGGFGRFGGGGGDGGGGGGGGWGDGDMGGNPQQLFDIAEDEADAAVEELSDYEEGTTEASDERSDDAWKDLVTPDDMIEADEDGTRNGTNRCVEVVIEGWPKVGSIPTLKDLRDMLNIQEGHIFNYQDIVDDRRKLEMEYDTYISGVTIETEFVDGKSNHQRVKYKFKPCQYGGIDEIEIKGATVMPPKIINAIVDSCLPAHPYHVDVGVMDKVRGKIEKWYKEHGLPFCYVGYFDGMDEGVLRAHVIEAKINDVSVRYKKASGGEDDKKYGAVVSAERIIQSAGFRKGDHYSVSDGYDAVNNVYACGLIEDIKIDPQQDAKDPSKINVVIRVDEIEPKSLQMDLNWAFQTKGGIIPKISRQALIPGGSVEISHENLFGDSQSLTCSLSSNDWRNPAQDLGFQFSYTEPFYAPHTTRNAQLFSTRKLSSIFNSSTEGEVPPVFVDRFGIKAWTGHCGGQDNKVEHNIILQAVSMVDENGAMVTKGSKVVRGGYADNGPPTTLSDTGKDVSLSYQHYTGVDDVQFVNGNQLGRRALFQVDQGLNVKVPGTNFGLSGGLYNRMMASYTKFMQIPFMPKLSDTDVWLNKKAPNTLVLHGRVGNCVGDMAPYDYFALGGPYSVRGYSHGELGAARRFVETAAEVRVPLKNYGHEGTLYGFLEYASDLGSSKELEGNPTEFYRKAGRGMTYGAGVKVLGACRLEYARDCNAGTGAFLVNWGERF